MRASEASGGMGPGQGLSAGKELIVVCRSHRFAAGRLIAAAVGVTAAAGVAWGDGAGDSGDGSGPAAAQANAGKGRLVYSSTFAKPPGAEWSRTKTEKTPRGGRSFLGRFGNDKVTLALEKLPEHAYLRVSFDLFVIHSWDGSGEGREDIWQVDVADGPVLLRTTFTNNDVLDRDTGIRQAYPGEYPTETHRGKTGAEESNTLGYTFEFSEQTGGHEKTDAVYRMSFAFPHRGDGVQIAFQAEGLTEMTASRLADESWGMDNVTVEAFDGPPRAGVRHETLAGLWKAMQGEDPVAAEKAVRAMMEAGPPAAAFLRQRIKAAQPSPQRIRELVARLDHDKFRQRQEASEKLSKMGLAAAGPLRKARAESDSEEVRARLAEVLEQLGQADAPASAEMSRALRVLRVVESR